MFMSFVVLCPSLYFTIQNKLLTNMGILFNKNDITRNIITTSSVLNIASFFLFFLISRFIFPDNFYLSYTLSYLVSNIFQFFSLTIALINLDILKFNKTQIVNIFSSIFSSCVLGFVIKITLSHNLLTRFLQIIINKIPFFTFIIKQMIFVLEVKIIYFICSIFSVFTVYFFLHKRYFEFFYK